MKNQKFISTLLILFVFLLLAGCSNNKQNNKDVETTDKDILKVGQYFGEPYTLTSSFIPVLTIENNNKFKFELGVGKSVEGTYRVDSKKLVLTSVDGDEYSFSISNNALIIEQEIHSYVKKSTSFNISE